jgi:hypothetical protein
VEGTGGCLPFLLNLNFLAGDKCMAKLANGKYRDAVVDSIDGEQAIVTFERDGVSTAVVHLRTLVQRRSLLPSQVI